MKPKLIYEPEALRGAIEEALPQDVSAHGEAPEPRYLYVPLRHAQALSPDHGLVVGIRGAGKSAWWAALQSESHRRVVVTVLPSLALDEVAVVSAGFGEANRPDDYPDRRVLEKLLSSGMAPAEIWRTVIAWNTWGRDKELAGLGSWLDKVQWAEAHPEEMARAFKTYDDGIAEAGRKHLVVFDALDRSAAEWEGLRKLLRGLLEVLLELRAFRAIRVKAFVRPDMLNDPAVTSFRDASKVVTGQVQLLWTRADLYGLLFQRLGNAPEGGEVFRHGCQELGSGRWQESDGIWQVPKSLREDEELQRKVFDQIAGTWMGMNRRLGSPYMWLPNHLADAAGRVSPSSFLEALRTAAVETCNAQWDFALHYEAIKKGAQKASQIRIEELKADFFWVPTLMAPLRGLVVPAEFDEIESRWTRANVIDDIRQQADGSDLLLPKHIGEGTAGLRTDLLDLALFSERPDGRINMPDVYRVGFGLGRMGGVQPIR